MIQLWICQNSLIIKMAHPKAMSKETSFLEVEVMVTFSLAIIPLVKPVAYPQS